MSQKKWNVAVVGATGNVGREIIKILIERAFPIQTLTLLASGRSSGRKINVGDQEIPVQRLDTFDFSGTELVLSSAGASVSAEFAPRAVPHAIVIDNTSYFRQDPKVPLVIPEVNADALTHTRPNNLVSNPNCSTIAMLLALKPLHDLGKVRNVVVSTYQSVSGAGKEAMDELFDSTKAIYVNERQSPVKFPKPIAFNVIPQIDVFLPDGSGNCKEEWKMQVETSKMLSSDVVVSATTVRVPVFVGHALSLSVELESAVSVEQAREALTNAPGVCVVDDPLNGRYVTPKECVGEDDVFVSRVRACRALRHGLSLWVVGDNIRKGAALNAVQIAEVLISRGIL